MLVQMTRAGDMRGSICLLVAAFLCAWAVSLSQAAEEYPPSVESVLVLGEAASTELSHKSLLSQLRDLGMAVTFRTLSDSAGVDFADFGSVFVLLSPSASGSLPSDLHDYVRDRRGSVLVTPSPATRKFMQDCGVEAAPSFARVKDSATLFDISDAGKKTLAAITSKKAFVHMSIEPKEAVALRATGESELLYPVVTGTDSSAASAANAAFTGTNLLLVSFLQARNNARVAIFASLNALADSRNTDLVKACMIWLLQIRGVIRMSHVSYDKAGSDKEQYRIGDAAHFEIGLAEWNRKSGKWVPHVARDPLLLEFWMLNPYLRVPLSHNGTLVGDAAVHSVDFQIPDVYGVFKFVVSYRSYGYSFVEFQRQIGVRPFHTNEYERFLPVARPYYAAGLSLMAGFFILCIVFLHQSKSSRPVGDSRKSQ